MRGSTIKKFRRTARREAQALFVNNVVVKRRWYLHPLVFTAFAWPVTQAVVFLNWLGWHSAGRWWVNYCRAFRRRGNVLVVRRAA